MSAFPASSSTRLPLPPCAGIGLKPQHYAAVLDERADAVRPGWVEVHPQNYAFAGGPAHRWLEAIACDYSLSFHSTGLSLGSVAGPCSDELEQLAELVRRYQPSVVSDHLSWSLVGDERFPDLLPIPYTRAALAKFCDAVSVVQDRLQRPILIENPSRYLAFSEDELDEPEFLAALCQRSGCGLLLDLNNVVVSAINLGFDPMAFVGAIDPALVGEVHLAGHAIEEHSSFALAIDDHGSQVGPACWELFEAFIARAGAAPTLIEWDTNVPDYAVLIAEAQCADGVLRRARVRHATVA
jgi:uncharacterized protein